MKRLIVALIAAVLAYPATAYWQSRDSNYNQNIVSAATYTGPGDIVTFVAWGSCARVYSTAKATTSTSMCDLVATTGGAAVCTLRGSASGYVDLTAYCPGSLTPSAACAAASGGSCKVTKVYNQVNPGTLDWTQATLANMPALTFSALNGLPGVTFVTGGSVTLATAATTQASPWSGSSVYKVTSDASLGGVLAGQGSNSGFGGSSVANLAGVYQGGGALVATVAAADNAFHAVQATVNTNVHTYADGSSNSGVGTTGLASAQAIRWGRSSGGVTMDGTIMEDGYAASEFNSTQAGNLNTNQHSATVGYNF